MNERIERGLLVEVLDRTAVPARDEFRRELWHVVATAVEGTDLSPVPTEPPSSARDRRRRAVLIAGVSAIAAALIVAFAWIIRPSETLAPTDSAVRPVATAAASTVPSTTAPPASVAPPSTQPTPTSTVPATVPPVANGDEPIAVSYLDPPLVYEPEVFTELDVAGALALGDGFVVAGVDGDPTTPDDDRLVVIELTGDHGTTTLDVDRLPRGLLAGPGRVVYGEVLLPGSDNPAPEQRFVAIALDGDRAGQAVVDVPSIGHPMDPLSDDFFDHSAQGVIDTWNGDAVMSGFVDPLGQPDQPERTDWPLVRYDYDNDIATQVGGPTWPLTIERHPDRPGSMVSGVGAGADGTAVYATWIGPRVGDDPDYSPPTVPVIVALMPDGTGTWYRLPDGWWVADSNVWGTLLGSYSEGRTQLAWFDPTTFPESLPGEEMSIVRPLVNPDVCDPVAAEESTWDTRWNEPFTRATDFPIAMQVFANPATGAAGPHALLLRYRDRPIPHGDATTEPINGWDVRLTMYPNGNADAAWYLADGGEAYLRVRDLGRDTVVALIESLTPRGDDAVIPGFDSAASERLGNLEMLHETMNTGLSGRGSTLACRTSDDRIYRVTAVVGDPLTLYLAVLDRPRPHDVALVDGTLIIVGGSLAYAPPFTADEVYNADESTWETLLQQPMP